MRERRASTPAFLQPRAPVRTHYCSGSLLLQCEPSAAAEAFHCSFEIISFVLQWQSVTAVRASCCSGSLLRQRKHSAAVEAFHCSFEIISFVLQWQSVTAVRASCCSASLLRQRKHSAAVEAFYRTKRNSLSLSLSLSRKTGDAMCDTVTNRRRPGLWSLNPHLWSLNPLTAKRFDQKQATVDCRFEDCCSLNPHLSHKPGDGTITVGGCAHLVDGRQT